MLVALASDWEGDLRDELQELLAAIMGPIVTLVTMLGVL